MLAELAGARTLIVVPMLKDNELVGVLVIYRQEVRPFTEKQIELVQNFAAQAVIAIENTRLLSELRESLQQQAATAEVLKVISSSPSELAPVFKAILEQATRICGAHIGIMFRYEDGAFRAVSMLGVSPALAEFLNRGPVKAGPKTGMGRLERTLQTIHIVDTLADVAYAERDPFRVATAELGGARSLLNVPMVKGGTLVGGIGIFRKEVRPFTDRQIELVTSFAAQAVIAIENARLLNELRQVAWSSRPRPRRCWRSSSARPASLQPVFQSMLENATRICEAKFGNALAMRSRVPDRGNTRCIVRVRRASAQACDPAQGTGLAIVARTKDVAQIADLRSRRATLMETPRSRQRRTGGHANAARRPDAQG